MPGAPLFPVLLKDGDFAPPAAETYYVIAGNGFFLERRTALYTASVPVTGGIPGLEPHGVRFDLRLPRPLPRPLVESALGYFRSVFQRWEAEAVLFMFYAPAAGGAVRFRLEAPPQTIRGRVERGRFRAELRLAYRPCPRPGPEWLKLGTIHSHGSFSPRHSLLDEHDEGFETGLHVTAGYVDSPRPEFEAAFVVGATRFAVPIGQVLESPARPRGWPKRWIDQIRIVEERNADGRRDGWYA